MGRREVKTRCGSGSPCRAPEVLVHMVTASACLGRHAKHLQPLWHAEGLMEIPCPSLLSQDCITCPEQDAHSCPPRGCRDTHVLFAKGCQVKLPLCRVAACAILQAEPPFHMAGQHMNCPKVQASCQAGNHYFPAIAALSFTCTRAMMFLFWLSSGLGSG